MNEMNHVNSVYQYQCPDRTTHRHTDTAYLLLEFVLSSVSLLCLLRGVCRTRLHPRPTIIVNKQLVSCVVLLSSLERVVSLSCCCYFSSLY
jgi:hypothetical protein